MHRQMLIQSKLVIFDLDYLSIKYSYLTSADRPVVFDRGFFQTN